MATIEELESLRWDLRRDCVDIIMAGAGGQLVVGRAGHVGPGAVGADAEGAVGAWHIGPGHELVGTIQWWAIRARP